MTVFKTRKPQTEGHPAEIISHPCSKIFCSLLYVSLARRPPSVRANLGMPGKESGLWHGFGDHGRAFFLDLGPPNRFLGFFLLSLPERAWEDVLAGALAKVGLIQPQSVKSRWSTACATWRFDTTGPARFRSVWVYNYAVDLEE